MLFAFLQQRMNLYQLWLQRCYSSIVKYSDELPRLLHWVLYVAVCIVGRSVQTDNIFWRKWRKILYFLIRTSLLGFRTSHVPACMQAKSYLSRWPWRLNLTKWNNEEHISGAVENACNMHIMTSMNRQRWRVSHLPQFSVEQQILYVLCINRIVVNGSTAI